MNILNEIYTTLRTELKEIYMPTNTFTNSNTGSKSTLLIIASDNQETFAAPIHKYENRFARIMISKEAYEENIEDWMIIFGALKFLPSHVKFDMLNQRYDMLGYSPFFPVRPEGERVSIISIQNYTNILENGENPVINTSISYDDLESQGENFSGGGSSDPIYSMSDELLAEQKRGVHNPEQRIVGLRAEQRKLVTNEDIRREDERLEALRNAPTPSNSYDKEE